MADRSKKRDPAVDFYMSPTQFKTGTRCDRLWWFQYPGGAPRTDTPATRFGKEGHTELEAYIKKDTPLTIPLAKLIAREIPDPATHRNLMVSEVEFQIAPYGYGFIDLIDRTGPVIQVTDFKFVKEERYAKTSDDLPNDPQMVMYGLFVARCYDVDRVILQHLSAIKTGPARVIVARAEVTRAHLEKRWAGMLATGEKLKRLWLAPDAASVGGQDNVPHAAACRMYGGCAFIKECLEINRTSDPFDGVAGTITNKADLLAHLRLPRSTSTMDTTEFNPDAPPPTPEEQRAAEIQNRVIALQRAQDALDPYDVEKYWYELAKVDSVEGMAEKKWWQRAVDVAYEWSHAPSPSELYALQERAEACPDFPLDLAVDISMEHPEQRIAHAKDLKRWIKNNPDVYEGVPVQQITPPDAPENSAPIPPDPKEQPVTDVAGVGKKLAALLAVHMGLEEGTYPTVAQAAGVIDHAVVRDTKGLSLVKANAIRAVAGLDPMVKAPKRRKTTTVDDALPPVVAEDIEFGTPESYDALHAGDISQPQDDAVSTDPAPVFTGDALDLTVGGTQDAAHADAPQHGVPTLDIIHDDGPEPEDAGFTYQGTPPPQDADPAAYVDPTPPPPFALYIDAYPIKMGDCNVVHLALLLEPCAVKVAADAKVVHYGMLPYGEGPALITAYLIRNLFALIPPNTVILAQGSTHRYILDALMQWCTTCVRGITA